MHYFLNLPSNRRIEIVAYSQFVLSLISILLGYPIKEDEIGVTCSTRREVD
jgi:hypothetical protein